ncbi:MAG: exodeoxyribonuclease VII small subunit [Deltaproteobacteria bacterium]|nr:exodeoxyribonuclease VII small subunit [Deltaproteobacteria bacterium]
MTGPGKTEKTEEKRFEDLLEELEGIVERLEQGELSLDESLLEYEKGIKLVKLGNQKLDEAEKKLEILAKGMEDKR